MAGSSTGGNNGTAGKGRSRKKKADRSTLNTAQVVTRSIAAASTARRVITSTDSDQSTKVPPALEENNDDTNDKVVASQEDGSPTAPAANNGPVLTQSEVDDKEETVKAPHYSLPEHSGEASADVQALALSSSEREKVMKQELTESSCDENLGEFSDEMSQFSFVSSHRTAIPGDEDYESNSDDAALSLDSNATDYTCKGRPQASYTILDLPRFCHTVQ
ncbi:unnamed protein product [Cylindrotheca closterium]|uniref:Uncharacterized protein n=1 Tax=Cylindrotheca closterium TaxID=2856 RepID=A0AAD2FRU8_9STRA|nr:unnamed protein product [Cylindrotheca closterium]